MNVATSLKRFAESAWYGRARLPVLRWPVPWRLPFGGWWLAHPDGMGARIVGYRVAGHPYEEAQWKLVARLLKPGMTFVDVGANQGFYALLASQLVGPDGNVVAFEPARTEARKLRLNLRMNRRHNVRVVESAVGDRDGETSFYLCLDHQGSWSSIAPPADDVKARRVQVTVPITRLDTYADEHMLRVDMVKLDIEGGELSALRGAVETLRRDRPVILYEAEDQRTRQWNYAASEIVEYLRELGYDSMTVDRSGTLTPLGSPTHTSGQNLVALPRVS